MYFKSWPNSTEEVMEFFSVKSRPFEDPGLGYLRVVLTIFHVKWVSGRKFSMILDISKNIFSIWQCSVLTFPSWWLTTFKSSSMNCSKPYHLTKKLFYWDLGILEKAPNHRKRVLQTIHSEAEDIRLKKTSRLQVAGFFVGRICFHTFCRASIAIRKKACFVCSRLS